MNWLHHSNYDWNTQEFPHLWRNVWKVLSLYFKVFLFWTPLTLQNQNATYVLSWLCNSWSLHHQASCSVPVPPPKRLMNFLFGDLEQLTPASQFLPSSPALLGPSYTINILKEIDPCQPSFRCFPKPSTLNLDEELSLFHWRASALFSKLCSLKERQSDAVGLAELPLLLTQPGRWDLTAQGF